MRPVRGAPLALFAALISHIQPGAGLRTWQPIRDLQKRVQQEAGPPVQPHGVVAEYPGYPEYPEYNLSVPIDHFHNDSLYEPHVDGNFSLRYWFDASHYQEGGPVIVLAAGETSGAHRLPFLRKGIAAKLAEATGGIAVILEHRYYGASFPFDDLSTESLRFLRTEQALADTAYFAQHVRFPGLGEEEEDVDLTPGTGAPWIVYGGSYAGAFAAFLRVLYPDVFWGAISSSGVTVAIHDYWQYFEAQRLFSPLACVDTTQKLIHAVDQILLAGRRSGDEAQRRRAEQQQQQRPMALTDDDAAASAGNGAAAARVAQLKTFFGLGNITHDDDFASVISEGLAGWQDTNWDPAVSSPRFGWYCGNVTAPALLLPELEDRRATAEALLAATSYRDEAAGALSGALLNFVGWIQATYARACDDEGRTQDECFSNRNATFYRQDDLSQRWRAWPYQYCTQWGYLATGSGVPKDRLPLVSRLLDIPYLSTICREAFNITDDAESFPDVESINRLGGFNISYPRLAIVDGEADPWRAATPHAIEGAEDRPSTTDEPFLLIDGGAVHHWDENGLLPGETTAVLPPPPILKVQAEEVRFVKAWVDEWAAQKNSGRR